MTVPSPQIYCPNLNCSAPLNDVGSSICENCHTPLIHRHLWAIGEAVLSIPVGSIIEGRYYVKSPQIWLDTQPGLQPDFPSTELPDEMQVYLYLYPQRLHVPEVFGICTYTEGAYPEAQAAPILLLENVPLNEAGHLFPSLSQVWDNASAVRQVYWLWQLLQLWQPLAAQGVSASLLVAENIRVDGWRVRLCQLFWDEGVVEAVEGGAERIADLSLADLANVWLSWVERAKPEIVEPLGTLCGEMRRDRVEIGAIAHQLNRLLLEQAAQLPLRLQVAGATDPGPQHEHNEDTCYPLTPLDGAAQAEILPQLAVVCDGIGGHEGGEVASQLAVQSLKLQIQALLTEAEATAAIADEDHSLLTPEVVAEQLEAVMRVINDLIASQNNAQGREARRRMGTTLVMALQLPQRVRLSSGQLAENSHELYLVNVGDSRAYWLTPRACHPLTIDDDVAAREVRMGRMLYREALQRPDAGALIQALGTRDAEFLHPSVQRFIVDEDGVLLLCSDGLSDNGRVEEAWRSIMEDVFRGKRSLAQAAQDWVHVANQKNGRDNVSVVLLQCHVSSPMPPLVLPDMEKEPSDWSASSQALLNADANTEVEVVAAQPDATPARVRRGWIVILLALLLIGGLAIWAQQSPMGLWQPGPEQQEDGK